MRYCVPGCGVAARKIAKGSTPVMPLPSFFAFLYSGQNGSQNGIGRQPFGLRFEVEQHPVTHGGQECGPDVIETDVLPALQ